MNYSDNKNPLSFNTVNQPIAIHKPLSDILILKLRNDSARLRELRKTARQLQNL